MATVEQAVRNLEGLDVAALKRLYESYYGHKTSLNSRDSICRAVAKKAVSLHQPRPQSAAAGSRTSASQLELEYSRFGGSMPGQFDCAATQAGPGTRSVVQNYKVGPPTIRAVAAARQNQQHNSRPGSASGHDGESPRKTQLAITSSPHRPSSTRSSSCRKKNEGPLMITTSDGKKIPHYMLNNKESGSVWFERCVKEMNISLEPPMDLMEAREQGKTADGLLPWVAKCKSMTSRILRRYSAKLCKASLQQTTSAKTGKKESAVIPTEKPSAERDYLVANAEWRLHRGVQRGPAYLYHVWTGVKRTVLENEYSGIYRIPSAVMTETNVQTIDKLTRKRQRLRKINNVEDPTVDEAVAKAREAASVANEERLGDDGGAQDYFEEVPYVKVDIDHNNLLQLRVYFGWDQIKHALEGKEEQASPYAFQCEAACINVDKWFGLTGPWKNKVIFFSRDQEELKGSTSQKRFGTFLGKGLVEAFYVDGFCFEKSYTENPCPPTDPFQCPVCTRIRRGNNFTYAKRQKDSSMLSGDLLRGNYFCGVCKTKRLHVSLSEEARRLRPRWDPTPARSIVEYSSLNDPPGKS